MTKFRLNSPEIAYSQFSKKFRLRSLNFIWQYYKSGGNTARQRRARKIYFFYECLIEHYRIQVKIFACGVDRRRRFEKFHFYSNIQGRTVIKLRAPKGMPVPVTNSLAVPVRLPSIKFFVIWHSKIFALCRRLSAPQANILAKQLNFQRKFYKNFSKIVNI